MLTTRTMLEAIFRLTILQQLSLAWSTCLPYGTIVEDHLTANASVISQELF